MKHPDARVRPRPSSLGVRPWLAASVLGLALAGARADELTFVPAQDTSIYSGTPGSQTLSDGAGPYLWLSVTAEGLNRRALVRFDVSAIPAGSVVREARLSLYESRSREDHVVSAHRLLRAWGEGTSSGGSAGTGAPATPGDATWLRAVFPDVAWTTPGGDFIAAPSASVLVGLPGEFYTWAGPGLVADVQAWVDQAANNHGWILIGNESGQQNAKRFESRNGAQPSVFPRLVVAYDPPLSTTGDIPVPFWALALLAGALGAGVVGRGHNRNRNRKA